MISGGNSGGPIIPGHIKFGHGCSGAQLGLAVYGRRGRSLHVRKGGNLPHRLLKRGRQTGRVHLT